MYNLMYAHSARPIRRNLQVLARNNVSLDMAAWLYKVTTIILLLITV